MHKKLAGCGVIAALSLGGFANVAFADQDQFDMCPKVFTDANYGGAWYRDSCADELRRRRAELDTWGVASKGMTDLEAWDRHDAEFATRADARREQERRDRLESERLAAERARADADRARIVAAREKEAEQHGAAQMRAGQQAMQDQNDMLKDLGVNFGGMSIGGDDDLGDDEYSATELQMYQRMVDDGAAPGCKGLSGSALVDCVDEALDAEED